MRRAAQGAHQPRTTTSAAPRVPMTVRALAPSITSHRRSISAAVYPGMHPFRASTAATTRSSSASTYTRKSYTAGSPRHSPAPYSV